MLAWCDVVVLSCYPISQKFEVTGSRTMNKNIVVIILIIIAAALVYFFAWPKIKPYIDAGSAENPAGETMGMPGAEPGTPGAAPNAAPQPQ